MSSYILYDELSVHGAFIVNVMAKHCLSYNQQFTDLVLFFTEYTGFSVFLPLTLKYVGLAVAVASGDDFTNRYIWQLGKLYIGGFPIVVVYGASD